MLTIDSLNGGHGKQVVLAEPSDATAHAVLGGVCGDLEPRAVADAYREVLAAHPGCGRAGHMLACLTGEGAAGDGSSGAAPG